MKIWKRILSLWKVLGWKLLYGKNLQIGKMTFFYPQTHITIESGGKLTIGDYCFLNHFCSITCMENIEIGKQCIFGEGVRIYDHNHKTEIDNIPFCQQGYKKARVKIGENCWIGSGTIILPGVEIGNNSVVAAGSVITKSVPDNSVVIQKRGGSDCAKV